MGQLKNHVYDGRGILYTDYTYDGYFTNKLKNGYFRVYKNNKKLLIDEGFYKDDVYHGKGIIYDLNGNKKYNGYFDNGKIQGIGIEYFEEGKIKRTMVYDK